MSRYHENADQFVYQTFTKKSKDTITKFIKPLIKFVSEDHADEIMYARLVSDEPSEIQHYRKSLPTWTTQQKN